LTIVAKEGALSILNTAKIFYLCHLSNPASDRAIYRLLQQGNVRKIVELGVATGERTLQMIEIAATRIPRAEIRYTGLDLFEARSEADGRGMAFKTAYQTLRATGATVQLVPGDPLAGLARIANTLGKVDLLIFSAGLPMSQPESWRFVPRLLHDRTQVGVEERMANGQTTLQWKPAEEIHRYAAAASRRKAA
jgi:hypothetical protein